ncbi:MAG TPA: hypothetical protein PLZ86_09175 [bacterium]|nr:hypothetical protein [bacterium]
MIDIIKKRINELKLRWEKSELSPEELQEFNALVDDVIRTARQPTIYGKNEERPEEFLLKLAERRIKGAVGAFLKEKEEQEEAKKEGPEAVQMLFNDYFIMAQLIVLLAILGDSLEHKARASIVKKHAVAFDPTESRFIAMVNTDIARDVKWILKECTPNKDDYPDFDFQTWAILMATRERGKTPEKGGLAYDPDYRENRLLDLIQDLELVEAQYELHKRGHHPYQKRFKTRKQFESWVKEQYGYTRAELEGEIRITRKQTPNFFSYVFGREGSRRPFLKTRLWEIMRHRRKQEKKDAFSYVFSDVDVDTLGDPDVAGRRGNEYD